MCDVSKEYHLRLWQEMVGTYLDHALEEDGSVTIIVVATYKINVQLDEEQLQKLKEKKKGDNVGILHKGDDGGNHLVR